MRNVPRRGEGSDPRSGLGSWYTFRRLPRLNTLCRDRHDVSPEAVVCLAERPACTGHEALGVGHMGSAIGVNMYLEMRKAGNQVAGPTRMIKVYMREQDMADVGESHAQLSQAVLEAVERRGRARVYDRRLGTVDPIRRDHPTKTEVDDIDGHDGHTGVLARGWLSLPFLHGDEVALSAPHEDLPGAGDTQLRVFHEFIPLRQPPHAPRNREEHGEHLHRKL